MKRVLICYTGLDGKIQVYKFAGNAYDLLINCFKLSDYGGKIFTSVWVVREEDYKKKILPLLVAGDHRLFEELSGKEILNLDLPRELEDLKLLVIQIWFDEEIIDDIEYTLKILKSRISIEGGIEISETIKLGDEILNSIQENAKSVVAFDVGFLNYRPTCKDMSLTYFERQFPSLDVTTRENTFVGLIFFKDRIIYSSLPRLFSVVSEDLFMEVSKIIREIDINRLKSVYSEEELLRLFCEQFGVMIWSSY